MSVNDSQAYFTANETYKAINPIIIRIHIFTPFYIAIAICSIIFGFLLILNLLCCCSRHAAYWLDRHRGNHWIVSIWSAKPHKQPSLDYTQAPIPPVQYVHPYQTTYYQEIERPTSLSQQALASDEYVEFYKRESDL